MMDAGRGADGSEMRIGRAEGLERGGKRRGGRFWGRGGRAGYLLEITAG